MTSKSTSILDVFCGSAVVFRTSRPNPAKQPTLLSSSSTPTEQNYHTEPCSPRYSTPLDTLFYVHPSVYDVPSFSFFYCSNQDTERNSTRYPPCIFHVSIALFFCQSVLLRCTAWNVYMYFNLNSFTRLFYEQHFLLKKNCII